mmetsp:Transcript_88634/g.264387  ORF Transcript_88634/g.264387 Transcript_88634/m.264387 type:complete len:140 (-) Transcript_88634:73-492(-)
MGSACCSDSAQVSREAKQDSMLTADEYKAGANEDAVILKMADATAVRSGKSARGETGASNSPPPPTETMTVTPGVEAAAVSSPPDGRSSDEECVVQADADPELQGIELENLCLQATPNRDRLSGRELLQGLSSRPTWAN